MAIRLLSDENLNGNLQFTIFLTSSVFLLVNPFSTKLLIFFAKVVFPDPDKPVIWRGPIKLGAIQQFIGDVSWGELDSLIIDFPPGTSDEPLTVSQHLPGIDGVVIVTTPQELALLDLSLIHI